MANYVLNEEKMFADISDGLAIVINSETGIYFGMNELGTSVFENIIAGASTEDILSSLQSLNGAPADIAKNMQAFIDDLTEKEILMEGDASSVAVSLSVTPASVEEFSLSVDAYDDAQELLLADPIHEVKEESGWTPEKESIGYTKEETIEREGKVEE